MATPTDYYQLDNNSSTKAIESILVNILSLYPDVIKIIKSTVPVGYREKVKEKFITSNIIFSKNL